MTERFAPYPQGYRLSLVMGIAACVGVLIACTGPWVSFTVFSLGGLEASNWGKVGIGIAAVSATLLTIVLLGPRFQLGAQAAVILAWVVFVGAGACVGFAVPYIVRVLTLPKADFFGLKMGAQVGWGLWLLAVSAVVLAIAAASAAQQLSRSGGLTVSTTGATPPANRYRAAALAATAAVSAGWIGYYAANWNGAPPGADSASRPNTDSGELPFGIGSSESSTSSSPAPTVTAGKSVQLGDLQVEVPGIWLQKTIGDGDNPFSSHAPRGIWVVAPIKVTNNSNTEQSFDSMGQKLVVDGKTYSSDSFAANDVASDARSSISLNPGFSGYVAAVFDVPTTTFPADDASLDLQDDFGGPHVVIQVDTSPKTQSATSGRSSAPPTASSRPSPTSSSRPSSSPAPPKTPGVPPITDPDLGLDTPLSRPACDGSGIVILGSAYTPGKYREQIERLLTYNPGASYLRTDLACPSLRQSVDGNPVYAVYRIGGRTKQQVCAVLATVPAGPGTYGKWLNSDPDPDNRIDCG
jgi:serine/threonine-protein kinase